MSLPPNRFVGETRDLPPALEEARLEITALAKGYGLDFFDTVFVMCTWEEINMLAAYEGFPVRYPHWRWGMEYLRMQKSYEYGLHKIYEMVINTNPSYAYLLDNNLPVDQKLVMAHVLGHVDFFKNNLWFSSTNRKMLDEMANHAARMRRHMDKYGESTVEKFVDLCLSLDNLIDPFASHINRHKQSAQQSMLTQPQEPDLSAPKIKANDYMDRHINPPEFIEAQRDKRLSDELRMQRVPERPERDVLGFLLQHADLRHWQRDVLGMIREEALYFAPQGQTKIMNEGWATFWHTRMMTRDILSDGEVVDYCDHHSGTVLQQPGQLNPYKMGVELFRHIEQRWDRGQFGRDWLDCESEDERRRWDTGAGLGKDKVFSVRQTHNDVTFLDTFLTADFCREQGFFTTKKDSRTGKWIIDSREFAAVKKQLLSHLASRGTPRVYVVDGNHNRRAELRLHHRHDGLDIQLEWAEQVLGNLARVWSRPVHLETLVDGEPVLLSHDGSKLSRGVPSEDAIDAAAEAAAKTAGQSAGGGSP
ncbi:MAG: SpoVR family protein [Myxococcales bacterium]|nr:SpoVR family protein [Myxococcales bacterium]